jgi:hypothetical protein
MHLTPPLSQGFYKPCKLPFLLSLPKSQQAQEKLAMVSSKLRHRSFPPPLLQQLRTGIVIIVGMHPW